MIDAASVTELKDILELASTVLHMLYVCIGLFVGAILFVARMAHKIEKADDKGTRAHHRITEEAQKNKEEHEKFDERILDLIKDRRGHQRS